MPAWAPKARGERSTLTDASRQTRGVACSRQRRGAILRRCPISAVKHDLAFLHTLASNVTMFDTAVEAAGVGRRRLPDVRHLIADDLLADARSGGMTTALASRVQAAMTDLASTGAQVVVCTCSTIGGAAEATDTCGRFIAMRIDRPMADRAASLGPDVLVLAALASTFEPTCALLEDSARRANAPLRLEERLVDGAWVHFERGDRERYYELIADAVKRDAGGFGAIVLAQASMAPAADLCRHVSIPILSSPRLGVEAALRLLPPT